MKSKFIIPAILLLSLSSVSVYALDQTSSTVPAKTSATGGPLSDSTITADVKAKFVEQKLFGKNETAVSGIKVVTDHGVVMLTGTVDSKEKADNAVKIAKSVGGVTDVKSSLVVKAK